MFYTPSDEAGAGSGLAHNPFNAIVTPRPIGWISTRDADGSDNLAPYSFFNAVAYKPPQVMFSSTSNKADRGDTKDSVANIRASGVFCVNIVEFTARNAMNASSEMLPKDVDEFEHAGLTKEQCETISCARISGAPAALECKLTEIITLRGEHNFIVLGEVTGIHMRNDCIVNGRFDITTFTPLARMGYKDYTAVRDVFTLTRPNQK